MHYIENRVLSGTECEMKVRLKSLRQFNCNGLYYNTQSNHTELIGTFIVNTVFLFCSLSLPSLSLFHSLFYQPLESYSGVYYVLTLSKLSLMAQKSGLTEEDYLPVSKPGLLCKLCCVQTAGSYLVGWW